MTEYRCNSCEAVYKREWNLDKHVEKQHSKLDESKKPEKSNKEEDSNKEEESNKRLLKKILKQHP